MKKRIATAILVMLMAVLMITPAFAIVEPTDEFYVADYAGVLSEVTEQEIIEANGVLENTCEGAQIVVVAVEYLDGLYSDEYALQVMNEWGVGDANEDNGMVLVFATKEGKGWLATGDGIDAYFTDNMADDYLNDHFWNRFDSGDYDKAVQNLFPELVEWYEDHYDARVSGGVYNENIGEPVYHPAPEPTRFIDFELIFYIFIIIVFVLIVILNSRHHFRAYYVHMGMPIPRFHIWHMWMGPHRHWHDPHRPHHNHHNHRGPRGPHGPSGFGGGFGGGAGRGGGFGGGMGRGGGGRSGGGGGGRR